MYIMSKKQMEESKMVSCCLCCNVAYPPASASLGRPDTVPCWFGANILAADFGGAAVTMLRKASHRASQ